MIGPKNPESAVLTPPPEGAIAQKLPPAVRKLLGSAPEKDWPKIRAFLIESEEEGELVEMLPEINRVMKLCPAKLMGRVGRREISADQLDKAYTQFHDSIHGVRQALYALLQLAGFRDYRSREDREPAEKRPTSSNEVQPGAEFPRAVPPEPQKASAPGPAGGLPKPMQATRSDQN